MIANERRTRAREYETILILRSDIEPSSAEEVVSRTTEVIKRMGGTLVKIDNWGRRRLAYPIRGSSRGVFVYLKYVGFEGLVAEMERNLGLLDSVVRYQTAQLRARVDLDELEVDPEDTTFAGLEPADGSDEEPGLAQRLGLEQPPRRRDEGRSPPSEDTDVVQGPSEAAPAEEELTASPQTVAAGVEASDRANSSSGPTPGEVTG
ncbi:MAG: 30S ribosomal protein S6 [Proteobacteria bacterium]|nr:30S ribosomal protein S6 [Pseudomonadota bacterium]